MIRSAITVCLVREAAQGPFVYHESLTSAIPKIAALGFDAVEIFPPAPSAIDPVTTRRLLADHNLRVAAVGTGAGFVVHKLTLTDPDPAIRSRALDFVKSIIDAAAQLGAPAIIGSMQGRHAGNRDAALSILAHTLATLAEHARERNQPLLYEPLNRYETNLFVRQGDAAQFLREQKISNVKILSDLFHMNIEEADLGQALRDVGELLGHVHFVDSNRRAAGMGHMDHGPIVRALREIKYGGYCSAECFPYPDSDSAAKQVIKAHQILFNSPE